MKEILVGIPVTALVLWLLYLVWAMPLILGLKWARVKGVSSRWLWFCIHPVAGWITYAILRWSLPVKCQACNQSFPSDAVSCPSCNHPLASILEQATESTQRLTRVLRRIAVGIFCAISILIVLTFSGWPVDMDSREYRAGVQDGTVYAYKDTEVNNYSHQPYSWLESHGKFKGWTDRQWRDYRWGYTVGYRTHR